MNEGTSDAWMQRSTLYNHLVSLGNYFPLDLAANTSDVHRELRAFQRDWRAYNPDKGDYKRSGLSLTSLDGEMDGEKDLTSLVEYGQKSEVQYDELSFRKLTRVFDACPSIHPIVEPFRDFLGRSHFLKLDCGGFFPYHRDSFFPRGDSFRIFVPFFDGTKRDFVFLLGPDRIEMEPGRAYFVNTRMEHALFSFEANSVHLVLNVELTLKSVEQVCRRIFSR